MMMKETYIPRTNTADEIEHMAENVEVDEAGGVKENGCYNKGKVIVVMVV